MEGEGASATCDLCLAGAVSGDENYPVPLTWRMPPELVDVEARSATVRWCLDDSEVADTYPNVDPYRQFTADGATLNTTFEVEVLVPLDDADAGVAEGAAVGDYRSFSQLSGMLSLAPALFANVGGCARGVEWAAAGLYPSKAYRFRLRTVARCIGQFSNWSALTTTLPDVPGWSDPLDLDGDGETTIKGPRSIQQQFDTIILDWPEPRSGSCVACAVDEYSVQARHRVSGHGEIHEESWTDWAALQSTPFSVARAPSTPTRFALCL